MQPILIILFRWIHITTACVAVGGVFFLRVVFPIALRSLEAEPARTMLLRTRRIFKMVIHTCILLLLISGTYNAMMNWHKYDTIGPLGQGLIGTHMLLALIVFGIALWLLAGPEPKKNHLRWMGINLMLMLLTIAVGSTLKYERDSHATGAAQLTANKP